MKDFSVFLVGCVLCGVVVRYIYQIRNRQISPTLSMWIIFFLGTSLSLITYLIAEEHDFRSGILNTLDVAGTGAIVLAIVFWGERGMSLRPFEKWYLCGVSVIVVYGLLTGDAWTSNVFTQILITTGYFPTIQNLMSEKKNTESFSAWGINAAAGLLALYPAIVHGNTLAILYSARSLISILALMTLMTYYEIRTRKKA